MDSAVQVLSLVSSAVVTIAAAIGAIVAIKGLSSWRAETRGRSQFELAYELLSTAYTIQQRLKVVRSPFMHAAEWASRERDVSEDEEHSHLLDTAHAYQQRWEHLLEYSSGFQALTNQARALWGEETAEPAEKLVAQLTSLNKNLHFHLQQLARRELQDPRVAEKVRAVIWAGASEPDEFADTVDDAVRRLEKQLSKHLGRT